MLSLRSLARSAPRTAARLAAPRTTMVAPVRTAALMRSSAAVVQQQQQSCSRLASCAAAFSTSSTMRAASQRAEVDEELSAKLASEIEFEKDIRENEPEATSVKDFLESGLFEIEDVPGREEVVLRRTYGDEKITVTFSIADLANYDPDLFDEDAALGDEDAAEGAEAGGRKADSAAAAEGDEDADLDNDTTSVPCRLSIVIEKPGQGALSIEASAQDGGLLVENLYHYKDAALAHEATAEASHAAQAVYPGPAFGSLDEDLQVLVDRYLEERGITQALAVFVPDYLDAKEQREYQGFLKNLKAFVDA